MRLSLDQLEAERGEVEPFELELGPDEVITLPHPKDLPFEAFLDFSGADPGEVLRILMGDKEFDAFAGNPRMTLGIAEKVLNAYYEHYGLGGLGEGAASLRSQSGSARPSNRTSRRKATA